jgi:hypothetical protein
MAALPVVLCGKNSNIAKIIAAGLLPEYEGTSPLLLIPLYGY